MTNMKLGYIGVDSAKRAEWEALAKAIGFEFGADSDDQMLKLRIDGQHYRFVIHKAETEGLAHIGWDAGSRANLESQVARLEAAGVAVTREGADLCKQRQVQALASFNDPNGFRTELFFAPQVSNAALNTSSPLSGGFVTGDEGLGHAVFSSKDQQATKAFYTDVLGFRHSDSCRGFMNIEFLRCNTRHHSLALIQWPDGKTNFQHLMFQLESLDDLGRTHDRVQEAGFKVAASIGRHNEDKMLSYYFEGPSGFHIEIGWGAVSVTDEEQWTVSTYDSGSQWGHKWSRG